MLVALRFVVMFLLNVIVIFLVFFFVGALVNLVKIALLARVRGDQ